MITLAPNRAPTQTRNRETFDIIDKWPVNKRYLGLRVEIDNDTFRESLQVPGQYTTVSLDNTSPIYLVIANYPTDEQVWEFLIDRESQLGQKLESINLNQPLILSPAEGSGYPVARLRGNSLFCFTTGSGIASLRPVVQYFKDHPKQRPSNLSIYYGESNPTDFTPENWLSPNQLVNTQIIRAVENQADSQIAYKYVQHAFEAHSPEVQSGTVFLSGAAIMVEKMVDKLLNTGVEPEQIFTNI